jgi:alpha-mannosidase
MPIDLLQDILPNIKNAIFPQRIQILDWKMKEGEVSNAQLPSFNDKSWTPVRIPLEWGKYDKTFWFRQSVKIPHEFAGRPVALLATFPEALLYVNGEAFFGLDPHHQEVLLSDKARASQQFTLAIQAYSGRKTQHSLFPRAELAVFNRTARSLAASLEALHELEAELEEGSDEAKNIDDVILQALKFLKWFDPNGEAYPEQIERSYEFLLKKINEDLKSSLPGLIYLLPTCHLNIDWLWTRRETVRKVARTTASALRLLDAYPAAKFSFAQPAQYAFLKEHYPELFKQVRARIAEGRWEVLGSAWIEHDAQILSGESLIRQLQYGKRFWKQEFGIDSSIAWLPDSFGFNGNLPQLLQKSGVKYFYTATLRRNDSTTFPHTSFWWEGIDGSRVLSHISPLNFGAEMGPRDLHISGGEFSPENSFDASLHVLGYGNGGGSVSTNQLERAEVFKHIVAVSPTQLSSAQEFFTAVEANSKSLPVWKGELYLEKHRGVFTSVAWIKQELRQLEKMISQTELFACLALITGKSTRYPSEALQFAWQTLLTTQSHHLLGGNSIEDAYKDVKRELESLKANLAALLETARKPFIRSTKGSSKEFRFSVFNPTAHVRSEYVDVTMKSSERYFTVRDAGGNDVPSQVIAREKKRVTLLCYIHALSPLSFANFLVHPSEVATPTTTALEWKSSPHGIETPIYRIRFDNKGTLSSVYDKKIRKELIVKGKRGNLLQCYRDTPKEWEAWDIDPDFDRHRIDSFSLKTMKVVESGPLRATVRLELRSAGGSTIVQRLRLYHALQRIDFDTNVLWKEQQTLLKAIFPINVKTNSATYEIPFGAIQRSSKHKSDEDKAKFEVPALQWADLSDQKFGVSILNDSKHGYDARDATLRLTLLRSPRSAHPLDPKNQTEPSVLDRGEHHFTYSLFSHAGDWKRGQTVLAARNLNQPIHVFSESVGAVFPPLVVTSKPNVIISSMKKAEDIDEIALRVYESSGVQTDCTFSFGAAVRAVQETDLLELNPREVKSKKDRVTLRFKPFEVKTLKLALKPMKLK